MSMRRLRSIMLVHSRSKRRRDALLCVSPNNPAHWTWSRTCSFVTLMVALFLCILLGPLAQKKLVSRRYMSRGASLGNESLYTVMFRINVMEIALDSPPTCQTKTVTARKRAFHATLHGSLSRTRSFSIKRTFPVKAMITIWMKKLWRRLRRLFGITNKK